MNHCRTRMALAPLLAALVACSRGKPADSMPAADSTEHAATVAAPLPAPPDSSSASPKAAASSGIAPIAGTAGKAARLPVTKPAVPPAAAKADSTKAAIGDYDRAIRPKFKINEKTGKIDTIRKP